MSVYIILYHYNVHVSVTYYNVFCICITSAYGCNLCNKYNYCYEYLSALLCITLYHFISICRITIAQTNKLTSLTLNNINEKSDIR